MPPYDSTISLLHRSLMSQKFGKIAIASPEERGKKVPESARLCPEDILQVMMKLLK